MPESPTQQEMPSKHKIASQRGIVHRMAHGIGAGMVATLLGIAGNLLLLPLYLRHWSVSVYGEWMTLYSVVSYIGALDIGLTTAATNAATHAFAGQRWSEFKRVQATAWALSLGIAVIGSLVGAAVVAVVPVRSWLRIQVINPHDSKLVIGGLAIAFLTAVPSRQLGSTYITLGEFAKYQWIYNAGQILTLLSIGIGLYLGETPVGIAMIVAVVTIICFVATYCLIWRRDENLLPALSYASFSTARSLSKPSGEFMLQMLGNLLALQGPVVVISRAFGGQGVALFTTTRTVSNVVKGILTIFRAPLRSEYASAYAQPTKDNLRSLFRTVLAIDTTVAVTLTAGLWIGGALLISIWSHRQIVPDPFLLHLLLVWSLIEGFLWMMAGAGNAANHFHGVSWGALAYALSSVLLAFFWVHHFGITAIPASGILCLVACMLPFSLRNARLELELPPRALILRVCIPFIAATGLSVSATCVAGSLNGVTEWITSSLAALFACIASAIVTGILMMTSADRRMIVGRLVRQNFYVPQTTLPTKESDHSYV